MARLPHRDGWVEEKLRVLLASQPAEVTLDAIGDAVGADVVDVERIDELILAIEATGVPVVSEFGPGVAPLLRRVLTVARELRARGGSITPEAISKAGDISVREVRVGLLYAQVLQGD